MRSMRTRVCMLIPGYHPILGRSESQLNGLLERIDRDRFAPFVLTRRLPGTGKAQMAGATPVIRRRSPLSPGLFFLSALAYLWKRRREFDVIHVHSIDSTALAGAVIKRLLPGKTLVQRIPRLGPGSSCDRLNRSRSGRRRLRFVLDKADTIVLPCPYTSGALAALGIPKSKIADIPDGIDTTSYSPPTVEEKRVLKRSFGIAENAFVAIVVTRLVSRANVDGVLESWKRVGASHPGAVLIVAGGGPEGPRLARQADAEFEGRSVIFTGTASEDEIRRLYRTADAYVSYSKSEGTSDAMLEAMSAGLPVVSLRGSGVDPQVRHAKTGFLFDADHPMDGADYLMRLAEDRALLGVMSATVRDEIVNGYSFERIARCIEGVYVGMPIDRAPETHEPAPATRPAPALPAVEPPAVVTVGPPVVKPVDPPVVAETETPVVIPAEPPADAVQTAPPPVEPTAQEPPAPVTPDNRRRHKKRRHKKKRDKAMA